MVNSAWLRIITLRKAKTRNGVGRKRLRLTDEQLPQTEKEADEMSSEIEDELPEKNESRVLVKPKEKMKHVCVTDPAS